MLLAIISYLEISNAVRSVAGYCSASNAVYWKAALGILAYINGTSYFGIERNMGRSFFGHFC